MFEKIARRFFGPSRAAQQRSYEPTPAPRGPEPPAVSWGDPRAWDAYWREHLARDPFMHRPMGRTDFILRDVLPVTASMLRSWGVQSVLLAGNGVSQWPRALAYAGFDATALDHSRVAVEHMSTHPASDEELEHFLRVASDRSAFSLEAERREGGSCALLCADLFDASAAPGPFDCVIAVGVLQGFEREGTLLDALAALDARLAPDGALVVVVWDAPRVARAIQGACDARGYLVTPEAPRVGQKRLVLRQASG